jgi:pimeloyl-ACP methyl ester carboxylesterase
MVKEKAVIFGNEVRLVGVIAEPNSNIQTKDLPGVLLWNAGLLHKVGPHRLFVNMARRLATLGFLVFRFDVSGKGDSETQRDGRPETERTLADIRDAMDFLSKQKSIDRFVLIGLCSGADEAFPVAVAEKRVAGLVLLDGFGYRTLGYYLHHYGPRIFKLDVWLRFLKGNIETILKAVRNDGGRNFERGRIFVREFPPKEKIGTELKQLVARQVYLLFIYSEGASNYYNYRNQVRDMFRSVDFRNRLEVEYFKEADHTYTSVGARNKLVTTVCDWMRNHFKCEKKPTN